MRETEPTPDVAASLARALAPAVAATAALAWAYAPNLYELGRTWSRDPNFSHGWLVIPVALLIGWRRRDSPAGADPAPCRRGWWALVAVLAARAVCYENGDDWLETATLLPSLACVVLTFGGRPALGRFWPAVAFLVLMFPVPPRLNDALARPLQRLATLGSCFLLRLTGLWVAGEGQVILVGSDHLEVAEACNGLSMLMCLAATVAAAVALLPMAAWKRAVLLASAVPVALFSNILRIAATAWCFSLFGAEAGGRFAHDAAGWLMMPLALALVGCELALLSWLVTRAGDGAGARVV